MQYMEFVHIAVVSAGCLKVSKRALSRCLAYTGLGGVWGGFEWEWGRSMRCRVLRLRVIFGVSVRLRI